MSLSTSTFRRLGATLTLTAAVATVTAPTTLANHQDVGTKTALQEVRATPIAAPDAVERYVRSHPQTVSNVECDAVCRYVHNHGRGITLTTDTLGGNGGAPLTATAPISRSSWSAAALAAGIASGTLVVLLAGTLLVLRRRQSVAA
jgi:hypothetical protein